MPIEGQKSHKNKDEEYDDTLEYNTASRKHLLIQNKYCLS